MSNIYYLKYFGNLHAIRLTLSETRIRSYPFIDPLFFDGPSSVLATQSCDEEKAVGCMVV